MLKYGVRSVFLRHRLILGCYQCHSLSTAVSAARKAVQEVQIPVPWGHIAGKWWGDTTVQPVLGLHGWEDNAATFDTLAPMLTLPSFLAVDMIGHGKSSYFPMGAGYYFTDAVVFIKRIAQHFNWSKISFIGHSFGSAMAYLYSALLPNEVDRYVSIDCARSLMMKEDCWFEDIRSTFDKTLALEKKMNSDPPSYTYEELVELVYLGSGKSPTKDSCKVLLERGTKKLQNNRYYLSRDPRVKPDWLGKMSSEFVLECAPKIKCKILSIRGKDGFLCGGGIEEEVYVQSLDILKKSAAYVEHHDVSGSHHLHLNNPENIAPLINKFFST